MYCWDLGAPARQLSPVNYCGGFDDQGNGVGTCSAYGCFDMGGNVNEWTSTLDESTEHFIVMGGDYTSEYYIETGVNNYLMRTCSPQDFDPKERNAVIGFRMAAVEDAANIVSPENGFAEMNNAGWWDNCTTGEQAAGIVRGVVGAVVSAIGVGAAFGLIDVGAVDIGATVGGGEGGIERGVTSVYRTAVNTRNPTAWIQLQLEQEERNLIGDEVGEEANSISQNKVDTFYDFVRTNCTPVRGDIPGLTRDESELAKICNRFYDSDEGHRAPPLFTKEKVRRALYNLSKTGQ